MACCAVRGADNGGARSTYTLTIKSQWRPLRLPLIWAAQFAESCWKSFQKSRLKQCVPLLVLLDEGGDEDPLLPSRLTRNDQPSEQMHLTKAFLSEVQKQRGLYRLDFRLGVSRQLATFLLQQSRNESESQVYTPLTETTRSEEVLQLARFWIGECTSAEHPTCPNENFENRMRFYPTRLVELPPFDWKPKTTNDEPKIRVVESKGQTILPVQLRDSRPPEKRKLEREVSSQSETVYEDPEDVKHPRGQYVTLSHCWGDAEVFKLLNENLDELKQGIAVSSLPATFQHAIDFARRLSTSIRYIWIDSLCIIQNNDMDWKQESIRMYDVYRNSFCNISATAAIDSGRGIYNQRDPMYLWEDEINLNTDGIPRPPSETPEKRLLGLEPLIHRCRIQDAAFWDRMVDNAPVNRRAWVLQERLLAPRVLHFCRDQIAWECRHMDAAECLPHGISNMALQQGDVRRRTRLKWSLPQEYGPKPLVSEPFESSHEAHENWKRVVERYSTTALTKKRDKLIALAGIAEMMSRQMGRDVMYIAGMWEKWLPSQLLWRVNPEYQDGVLMYPQRRPESYRAPTFSWAAIEAPQGIKCGETLKEHDMEFSVDKIHLPPKRGRERFGGVEEGCYIEVTCTLSDIEIVRSRENGVDRYKWRLLDGDTRQTAKGLYNLYLDSPLDDIQGVREPLLLMPAHKDTRGYLTSLVLKLAKKVDAISTYRRVGLAIVPPYWNHYTTVRPHSRDGIETMEAQSDARLRELTQRIERLQLENEALRSSLVEHGHLPPSQQTNGNKPDSRSVDAGQDLLRKPERVRVRIV